MSADCFSATNTVALSASIADALAFEARRRAADELHARALDVLHDTDYLHLPAWEWRAPHVNPPALRDRRGHIVCGELVPHVPARTLAAPIKIAGAHRLGSWKVDAVLVDGDRPLGIVLHVPWSTSAAHIRDLRDCDAPVLEIDLSHISAIQPASSGMLQSAILEDERNRSWLHHPDATGAWAASHDRLFADLSRRRRLPRNVNRAESDVEMDAWKSNRDELVRRGDAEWRRMCRRVLEMLPVLSSTKMIEVSLTQRWQRDRQIAEALVAHVPSVHVADVLRAFHPDAWVYLAHPCLWQARLFMHWIAPAPHDGRVDKSEVTTWLRREIGADESLAGLFDLQYAWTQAARDRGYFPKSFHARFLTPEENAAIPNLFAPVNDLLSRLVDAGVLRPDPQSKRYFYRVRMSGEGGACSWDAT